MAKIKTPQDLKDEANKIMAEARKKQALLIREAKELEKKKYMDLGLKCVEFLNKKATEEELISHAIRLELIEKKSEREMIEANTSVTATLKVDEDV